MDVDQARELEALEGVLSDPSKEPIVLSYGILKFITKSFSEEIGRGGFAVVYKGWLKNRVVAVKKSINTHVLPDKQFMDEFKCLTKANHKNVVKFLGYAANIDEKIMPLDGTFVMAGHKHRILCFEYAPNGNVRQYLEKRHGDDWPTRYQMIIGICQGLHYLHNNQINHLDLKPENVVLDAQMKPKITDFGVSRFLVQGQSTMVTQNIIGTRRYVAPESKDKGEISVKSDIYALGIIIMELVTGISMIDLENWEESLVGMDGPGMRKCAEIARKCIEHDKHKRPTIDKVITELDELESLFPRSSINQELGQSSMPLAIPDVDNYMVPSRSLVIVHPKHWRWTPRSDSRYGECAELLAVNFLKVSMKFTPKSDQPAATIYTAHLVYKLALSTSGLQDSVLQARTHIYHVYGNESKVILHPKGSGARRGAEGVTYPITRSDGWLELKLAEFSNEQALTVELLREDPHNPMSGLIIKGMEVRRH